ncbi:hypothetical protein DFS34DRAFT_366708 [Phlyctochytrium arcticum]|nr:hypothetical protein DFS34DRAFT_366708 [Phlyctochytrium arcticum]
MQRMIQQIWRYWTLQCDLLYSSFRNDEGISVNLGGYIASFSGYFNYTRLYTPDGTFTETAASLPRDIFATIKMKVVYDTIQLFVNIVLVSTKSNDTSNVPPSTDVKLLVFGESGGFASQKVIDNISLVQDSNATEVIKFAPYNGKVTSQVVCQDDGLYGSSLIFSSSTGPTGTLQGQMKIAPTGVYLTNNKLVASQEYVNTQIAAIPLSNYTLISTYNTQLTTIDARFTPIKTRLGQLKSLSNLDTIDLSTSLVTGVLPISKVDTSTLQPLITSGNATSIKTTLGLSSTASSGVIDWPDITGKPTFGSLSGKNNIDLASGDVTGVLPIAKVNVSTLQPIHATLSALSSATPSIAKSLILTNGTSGSNLPVLKLIGGGGNENSVSIQMSPWNGRPGGISTKISAIDDNTGGSRLAFYAASGSDSTPISEFLSGTSTGVSIPKFLSIGGGGASGSALIGGLTFQYSAGGYRNFITSRHNGSQLMTNAIDFHINSSTTANGSSAPGTGNLHIMAVDATGVYFLETSECTSLTTGALRVSGGAAITKNLQVGGAVFCHNTQDSTELMKTGNTHYYHSICTSGGWIPAMSQQNPLSVGSWTYSSTVTTVGGVIT